MKKIVKFSKSIDDIFEIKKDLFRNNNLNLKNTLKINKKYTNLKKRYNCINCNFKIVIKDFISHKVPYSICRKCKHINGMYLMDKKFNQYIYSSNKGKNFSHIYSKNYKKRVDKIYLPKVKFMKQVLKKKIKVLDFGCGAGHFVKACEVMNVVAEGVDPNYELIKTGRKFINKNNILNLNFEESFLKMLNTNADVISLIFVLEHLENPERVFRTFAASNAQYLYISVPLFSLTSLIQSSFDRIYPRQLGGPHTHLYTKESLEYIAKKNNLKIIGEWWFGTDFLDFYRSLVISQKYTSKAYIKQLDRFFLNQIDNLQNILDKNKICSEVHLIFKKNKSL